MITINYVNTIIAQAQRAAAEYLYQVAIKSGWGDDPDNLRRRARLCLDGAQCLQANNDLNDHEKQIIIDRLLLEGGIGTFSGVQISFTKITVIGFPQYSIINNYYITGGLTPDATTTEKGKLKLAGDLGGTADLPTVPNKKDKIFPITAGTFGSNIKIPVVTVNTQGDVTAISDVDISSSLTVDLPFIVPNPLLSTPGDDTAAIQDAINRISPTTKGVVYLQGKKWFVNDTIYLPIDRDVTIEGYGAEIRFGGVNKAVFESNFDINNWNAQANISLEHKFVCKGLTIWGQADRGSIGINLMGTYGSRIESCRFVQLGTGFIGTFCLSTTLDGCFATVCFKDHFVLRSGSNLWPGADPNNSQCNDSVIRNCRAFSAYGAFSCYKFLAASECKLIDSISEGVSPYNCIVHNALSRPNFGYEQTLLTAIGNTTPNTVTITVCGESAGTFTNITTSTDLTSIRNAIAALPKCVAGNYDVYLYGTDTLVIQGRLRDLSSATNPLDPLYNGVVLTSNTALNYRRIAPNEGSGYFATTVTNFTTDTIHIECTPLSSAYKVTSYGLTSIIRNYYVSEVVFVEVAPQSSECSILIEYPFYVTNMKNKGDTGLWKFKGYGNTLGNVAGLTNPSSFIGATPFYRSYEIDQIFGKFFDKLYAIEDFILATQFSYAPGSKMVSYTPWSANSNLARGVQIQFAPQYIHQTSAYSGGPTLFRPLVSAKEISQNEDPRDSFVLTADSGTKIRLWFSESAGVVTPHYDII